MRRTHARVVRGRVATLDAVNHPLRIGRGVAHVKVHVMDMLWGVDDGLDGDESLS